MSCHLLRVPGGHPHSIERQMVGPSVTHFRPDGGSQLTCSEECGDITSLVACGSYILAGSSGRLMAFGLGEVGFGLGEVGYSLLWAWNVDVALLAKHQNGSAMVFAGSGVVYRWGAELADARHEGQMLRMLQKGKPVEFPAHYGGLGERRLVMSPGAPVVVGDCSGALRWFGPGGPTGINLGAPVNSLATAGADRFLAVTDRCVYEVHAQTGTALSFIEVEQGPTKAEPAPRLKSITLLSGRDTLAIGLSDGNVREYSLRGEFLRLLVETGKPVLALAELPGGELAASTGDGAIWVARLPDAPL